MADPSLYTAALEYHVFPDKYEGPESQIIPRKQQQSRYVYKNATPEYLNVSETPKGLILTNHSGSALCIIEVQPTEQRPVHFKIKFKYDNYGGGHGYHFLVPRFKSVCNNITLTTHDGIDLTRPINYELDGTVSIKGNDVITTICGVSKVMPKENEICLCLHIYLPAKTQFTLI